MNFLFATSHKDAVKLEPGDRRYMVFDMPKPAKRLQSINYDTMWLDRHPVTISIGYDTSGRPVEISFISRGKIGHDIDMMLQELGIKVSRALQDRDLETGQLES